MERLKEFEFSRLILKQTHAMMNTFVARFARSYLSYLFSCFGCITFKPARKKLFWLLCNNAKAGKSLAKTNKKWVSECGVRRRSLCFCFSPEYCARDSCKKRVKSTAQQQSTEQRSCSPLEMRYGRKTALRKRHLRHFLPLFSPDFNYKKIHIFA